MHVSQGRRVTRADVARYAGVSTAVVSYVLNNGPRPVAPRTEARVREAMEVLHYRPNHSARALKRGSSQTVGLILADSLNPHCSELSLAIAEAAAAAGYRVLVTDSRGDEQSERELIEDLLARQVDGLLFASTFVRLDPLADVLSFGVPVVLLECPGPVPGRHTVGPSARKGARDLVRHLAEVHGRRSIGLLVGAEGFGDPDPREVGWLEELTHQGLARGPIVHTGWDRESGYTGARELLRQDPRPDAILAASDQLGMGALRALHEEGIDVPGEVSVVSFDGTLESGYCWPPLTCARQPREQMAQAVIDLVAAPGRAPAHHEFPMELIIRASCGCPTH